MSNAGREPGRTFASELGRLVPFRRVKDTRTPALPPGTLIHVGEKKTDAVSLHVIDYSVEGFKELTTNSVSKCVDFETRETPTWIRVVGLHEVDKIAELLRAYDVHPLVQEDILNTKQMPKVEDFDEYLFVVIRLISPDSRTGGVALAESFSLLLTQKIVITFQESDTDVLSPVIERIRKGKGHLRRSGCDYLMWAILDAIVDHYFVVLAKIEDQVETLDTLLLADAYAMDPASLHSLKQQIFLLHRMIRPAREVITAIEKSDSPLITEKTAVYFRDLYDHAIHAIDTVESLRESAGSLRDFHMAAVSNRMNEIMKVLTCFATIFLPLTFLAGIYGMNFENIPELKWPWAYPALWVVFIAVAGGMFFFFRKNRWL